MEAAVKEMAALMQQRSDRLGALETREVAPPPPPSECEKRFKLLEEQMLLTRGNNIHRVNSRAYQPVQGKLPANLTFIPKFKGNGDPVQHIHASKEYLELKDVPAEMLTRIFAQSLEEHPKAQYQKLDHSKYPTFEDIAVEFARHYAHNIEIKTNMRTLEVMVQKEKEEFTEFLTRWRKESITVTTHILLSRNCA